MIILIIFAFIAGIVTILSPCILPILPIILSTSVDLNHRNKSKPYGVVLGFVLSFTLFTLFLSSIVKSLGISANSLRTVAVVVIAFFGLTLLSPKVQVLFENLISKFSKFAPDSSKKEGFFGGMLVGISLGLLWTPCVGPILASVISLAIIGNVSLGALFITLAYSIGTALPMFGIIIGGRNLLSRFPSLTNNLARIQMIFGLVMILTAVAIALNFDRRFQTYILNKFPNYGSGLTSIEDNAAVEDKLQEIRGNVSNDFSQIGKSLQSPTSSLPKIGKAPDFMPSGQWYNSQPLTLKDLRGKVVLVDFWTYSCINCQRTLPYIRTWWDKYKDQGLVIVGVHAPEFEFEKNPDNVAQAIKDFKLQYPIFQDNDFKTWRAYNNHYWPAKYLIDKDGYIRYTHFGEGKYDETEKAIQILLEEAGSSVSEEKISNPETANYARTPETYLGLSRISNFASPEKPRLDQEITFSVPNKLGNNKMAYQGKWYISAEYANPKKGSNLYYNFNAKEVYLVMSPKSDQAMIKVYVDGKVQYQGDDVNQDGIVTIDSDRLYKLVKLPDPGKHLLRIEFLDDETQVYAFTFG
jgi:cytochrome c biogenesis protein CcdA/thiol-disulfide isomerase/thioredoxin